MKIFVLRGEVRISKKETLWNDVFKAFKNIEDGEKYVFDMWEGITKAQDDRYGECYILPLEGGWIAVYWFVEIELL